MSRYNRKPNRKAERHAWANHVAARDRKRYLDAQRQLFASVPEPERAGGAESEGAPPTTGLSAGIVPGVSEADFQAQVLQLAKLMRWRCYHTHDSRRSEAGFPDLTLVRGGRLIFAELKAEKGKVTGSQQAWLTDLKDTGAEVYLWRPSDWVDIERILRSA